MQEFYLFPICLRSDKFHPAGLWNRMADRHWHCRALYFGIFGIFGPVLPQQSGVMKWERGVPELLLLVSVLKLGGSYELCNHLADWYIKLTHIDRTLFKYDCTTAPLTNMPWIVSFSHLSKKLCVSKIIW